MSSDTVFASFPTLLALRCSSVLRCYEGSDSCTLHLGAGLIAFLHKLPGIPSPTTLMTQMSLYTPLLPAHLMCSRLRHHLAGSPSFAAESSSLYYGLPVRFRLLSTPHRCDAVTFGYGVLAYSDMDLHHAVCAPSRAH